jgi:uncharacterized protein YxeA
MKKHLFAIVLFLMMSFFLVACDEELPPIDTELELTQITFIFEDNLMIDYGSEFNVLSNVIAVGDDAVDYSDQVTYTSTATISAAHMLDTTVSGAVTITYTVTVGDVVGQRTRTLTVREDDYVEPAPEWAGFNMTVVNGENDVTITYADTPAMWWNNNSQLVVEDFDGTKETISFTFTGVAGHEYLFKIEQTGGVYKEQPIVADGTEQTISISLSSLSETERASLNLIVFFVKTLDADGTVVIKDWVYGEPIVVEEPEWVGYNFTVVETETDATFTYPATPANWWENNAQLAILDFDGTKNSVDFTFTGVSGHEYVFKIEKQGTGINVEQSIVADGTEQTITIDLSGLSVADRDGLNLIVLFVKTEGAEGSVVVKDWVYGEPIVVENPVWVGYNFTVVETDTDVTLTYPATPANWWENNAQLAVVNFDGTKTAITFTFTGVATHEYVFKIEGPGGINVEQPIVADGTEQTVTVDLSSMTEVQRDSLNLIIVFVKTEGAAGSVVVKDWMYVIPEPMWIGYNFTAVETETDVTLTYPATPANWWENNAQLVLLEFDGTKNSVVFTFTGVATHEYLFKIEGPGGVNKEQAIVADGTEQTVTLDLSLMTDVQRESLNLIVVFVKTEGAAGSVVVKDWMYGEPIIPTEPEWVGYNFTVVETETDVTLTYPATPANWWENNAQLAVVNFDGTVTSISFTFTGVATHEYVFKIEGPGGVNVEQPIVADGTEQTVILDLSTLTEVQRASFNLIIVFVKTEGAVGSVVVKDWMYVIPEPMWIGYNFTAVETETDVTLTYPATPATWWDNNAQLAILDFDGTENSVVFTFTGVATHEYLFKIEGPGGINKEQAIVADGTEQTVTLDLSLMTEVQRDSLNLIIVFVKTEGAAGSVVVKDWMYGDFIAPVAPEWVGVGGISVVNGDGDDVTINYVNTPNEWWNSHAKLAVVDFDQAKTSLQFTFTGVAGHSYLFKVEGPGVAFEQGVVGTGAEQVFTLNISSLTEVQRDAINLIVVFCQTPGSSGTLIITDLQ